MFVCLSVHVEQLGSHSTDFPEILYLSDSSKSVERVQHSLKYTRITGTLRLYTSIYIYIHL